MPGRAQLASVLAAALASATVVGPAASPETPVAHGAGLATKKAVDEDLPDPPPLLATLEQVHSGERVPLDARTPTQGRFDELLSDRATGTRHALDGRLLELLRRLAAQHPGARIELVSGYRSWKLNEMLRKKGHHVASHSQHSLGHACDFRIIPRGDGRGLPPGILEREIRELGWDGGVGIYPTPGDWFVHADVGPNRRWVN